MKFGLVPKLEKRKKKFKKNDVMSANCDVIVIFPILGQFGAIERAGLGRGVCKTYIFINSILLCTKTSNRTKKSLT